MKFTTCVVSSSRYIAVFSSVVGAALGPLLTGIISPTVCNAVSVHCRTCSCCSSEVN